MWSGTIHYLTGGTTRVPRAIAYSADRWKRSVRTTAQVLEAHGVDSRSRVAVCQPFAPWAIGPVFAEAALACGAAVFPLGLYAGKPQFLSFLELVEPTHFCATARNLIRWRAELDLSGIKLDPAIHRVVFAAGEFLLPEARVRCAALWNADLVNVYGLAEFDTVAAEQPGTTELTLVSSFDYAVKTSNDGQIPLQPLAQGNLLIRESPTSSWFETNDEIRVVGQTDSDQLIWQHAWTIELIGRTDETIMLSDGSCVSAWQLRELQDTYSALAYIQLQVRHTDAGDVLTLLCVPRPGAGSLVVEEVVSSFLAMSIDVADSYSHGVIRSIQASVVDEAQLHQTSRGKLTRVVET